MMPIYDIDQVTENEVNYSGQYYSNDSPDQWTDRNSKFEITVTDFDYKFNSRGYRCDEFDLESELPIMFSGCSHTFGLGIPVTETWAYKTLENIRAKTNKKIPYWNIAINGSSLELQYFVMEKYIPKLKPKYLFMLAPHYQRRFIRLYNRFFNVMAGSIHFDSYPREIKNAYPLLFDEQASLIEYHKICTLINALCYKYNVKVYMQFMGPLIDREENFFRQMLPAYDKFTRVSTYMRLIDLARDRAHAGVKSNNFFAECLWREVGSQF